MERLRTIGAIMRREFILMVRYPTWIIQMIIWPLIFPLMYILSALGFAGPDKSSLSVFNSITGTSNYTGYLVIGTMAWMWVSTTMWGFGTCLREEQMRGTLESNWLCPIKKFDFLVGECLMDILNSILVTVISILEYRFIYGVHFSSNVLYWILIYLVMMPGIYGLGTMFASLVLWAKEANPAVHLVRGFMMIVCGITFPIAITPLWLQSIAKAVPFTYGITAARQLMVMGNSLKEASYNVFMCLILGLILLILGRVSFLYTEKRVKNQGALGRY
ncbi:ABC transporter permease [Haloimpatiens sp. FM7315]|uniref:ABC transporter permease n=1 Tax=Haloimpatiens sp. FM7315 TaxID=3298609 RepID=UPI0035A39DE9